MPSNAITQGKFWLAGILLAAYQCVCVRVSVRVSMCFAVCLSTLAHTRTHTTHYGTYRQTNGQAGRVAPRNKQTNEQTHSHRCRTQEWYRAAATQTSFPRAFVLHLAVCLARLLVLCDHRYSAGALVVFAVLGLRLIE